MSKFDRCDTGQKKGIMVLISSRFVELSVCHGWQQVHASGTLVNQRGFINNGKTLLTLGGGSQTIPSIGSFLLLRLRRILHTLLEPTVAVRLIHFAVFISHICKTTTQIAAYVQQ